MYEAERLANAGVRELLVISQDTSAYGVDKVCERRRGRVRHELPVAEALAISVCGCGFTMCIRTRTALP